MIVKTFLASKGGKYKTESAMQKLESIYPDMKGLDHFAIAPNLLYKHNGVLILIFVNAGSYLLPSHIKEMFQYYAQCESDEVFVINDVDLKRLRDTKMIGGEMHNRLVHYSIPLEEFTVQTDKELEEEFERRYKIFKQIRTER